MLYAQKTSFSFLGTLNYYFGCETRFIVAKTNMGIWKLILPHIFAFALLSMLLLHFLLFTKFKQKAIPLVYTLFILQFLEIFSPFLISKDIVFFVIVKLLSLILYLALLIFVFILLVLSIRQS